MTSDAFFSLACVSIIALLFGSVVAFAGYRFFLVLLPIWGFFFGFGLGAETVQAIFGTGFLSDVTSWVVGFVVALIFAGLSYLFYLFAVALVAGSIGYALGVGVMLSVLPSFGFTAWLVGIILGILFAIVVLRFNIQKWVIIAATALWGAGIIVGTFLFLFGGLPLARLLENPVALVLRSSPFWLIVFVIIAVVGFIMQYQSTRELEVTAYNRMTGQVSTSTGK
jgi:Ni,Fe-hydrogenase I cytochrome b subunit